LSDISANGNLSIAKNINFNGSLTQNNAPFTTSQWTTNTSSGNIYYSGNVGIGTTDPQFPIDISGRTNIRGNLTVSNDVSFNGNMSIAKNINFNGSITQNNLAFTTSQWTTNTSSGNIYFVGNIGLGTTDPQFRIDISGRTNIRGNLTVSNDVSLNSNLSVDNNVFINGFQYVQGNVGIGKYPPLYALDISGSLNVSSTVYATSYINTSDYRIKNDPIMLDAAYSVDDLRPVHYINKLSNKKDIGFLAHEVQQIFPYLVEGNKDDEKYQSMNYIGLIAVLVKEVQELKKENKKLKQTNIDIDSRLKTIEQMLSIA
jgi:cytoskeletal protein CcmA (bactofilin family)